MKVKSGFPADYLKSPGVVDLQAKQVVTTGCFPKVKPHKSLGGKRVDNLPNWVPSKLVVETARGFSSCILVLSFCGFFFPLPSAGAHLQKAGECMGSQETGAREGEACSHPCEASSRPAGHRVVPQGQPECREAPGAGQGTRVGLGIATGRCNGLLKHLPPSVPKWHLFWAPLGIPATLQIHPFLRSALGPALCHPTGDASLSAREKNGHLWSMRFNGGSQGNSRIKTRMEGF